MIVGMVALISILFGGGLSFDSVYKPVVKDVVADQQRYEQIAEVFDTGDDQIATFRDEFNDKWEGELNALVSDFDATRDDFRDWRKRFLVSRSGVVKDLLDVRFSTIKLMTEDEWKAMFKALDAQAAEDD